MLERCSTKDAPWYVVPSETRWYRDLVIAQLLVDKMKSMRLRYPKPDFDPRNIVLR